MADPKEQAVAEKELGNAAYKKKDFTTAIQHYDKAIGLDSTNMAFYLNKAAVFFEQGKYEDCISTCEKAVEIGRENKADYKLMAKGLARIGNAYYKMENLDSAVKFLNSSLTEHRNPDVVRTVNEIEKAKKEKERLAYINPELAVEEKNKGNEFFKKGSYPEAVKHYTEAIKRNPEDAKLYSNRAACYQKLLAFPLALKDCEDCIRLEPTFIKGYLRKGHALLAMKDPIKAKDAFLKALELDGECKEALDGCRECMKNENPEDVRKHAMSKPEVQEILADPAMRMILEQMQENPQAVRDHLKNPEIMKKIETLISAGIVAFK